MPNFGQLILANLTLVILLGSLSVWLAIFTALARREPLVELEPRRPVPWTGRDVIGLVLFGVWCELLSVRLGQAFVSPDTEAGFSLEGMAASAAGRAAWVICAVSYLAIKARARASDLGWDVSKLVHDLRLGGLTLLAAVVPVFAVQLCLVYWLDTPSKHPLIELVNEQSGLMVLTVATLVAAIVAPLFEELLFRVVLQGWLESRQMRAQSEEADELGMILPARPGIAPLVFVSVVFAAMHLGSGPDPAAIFLLSLFLGFVFRQTHRIVPSLTVHFGINSLTMLQLWVGYYWPS